MAAHKPPEYLESSFTCPWCGAFAQQKWINLQIQRPEGGRVDSGAMLSQCVVCEEPSLWYDELLVVPTGVSAPLPHPDLPDPLRDDYLEARDIAQRSPRGAAALLRLLIEQLCPLAGGEGKNLNACIGDLVSKGLHSEVQEMLDTVRVIGNEAVHPVTSLEVCK